MIFYSLEELFQNIDECKEPKEFFYEFESGGEGAEYYIELITDFEPQNNPLILADCHKEPLNDQSLDKEGICVDGYLIFDLLAHDEDFKVFRVANIEEVEKFILSDVGIYNMFTRDIVVLENGIRKKYYINDKNGNRVGWQQFYESNWTNRSYDHYIEWDEEDYKEKVKCNLKA